MSEAEPRSLVAPSASGEFDGIASVVSSDVYRGLHDAVAADPERTRAALAALPGSWERVRADIGTERHLNRAERRTPAKRRDHR